MDSRVSTHNSFANAIAALWPDTSSKKTEKDRIYKEEERGEKSMTEERPREEEFEIHKKYKIFLKYSNGTKPLLTDRGVYIL